MDEWTGVVDAPRVDELARALAGTVPDIEESLREMAMP